ncbi:hypothetical protein ENSA7_30910 [Enhygromyxa salina]|uniref:Uncharacterized protein n=2 Tax=Enhygromyxa salina TaxID=215803 RepID=A0A2S9YQM5_9BACT|nr:hypothetical protein ENSA7_30910 [Enhygromyxa salina]
MFGQTEPGSFVVRVLVPLPPQVGGTQGSFLFGAPTQPEPFGRRVTSSLLTALSAARRALVNSIISETLDPFRDAVEQGVSVELCRALSVTNGDASDGGVEVSVAWGLSAPRPAAEPVLFQNSDLDVLGQAADFLAETQAREDFELEGYIIKLARGVEANEGDITIAATIDRQILKVLVGLPPGQYKTAGLAHTHDLKVSVVGELGKEGRQYRLFSPRNLRVVPAEDTSE